MSNLDNYFDDLDFLEENLDYLYPNPKKRNENMEKQFTIMAPNQLNYKTYEDAEKEAKQRVGRNHQDYVIVKAIAVANTPTPDVSVTKL